MAAPFHQRYDARHLAATERSGHDPADAHEARLPFRRGL
jgi:hypothetical protein